MLNNDKLTAAETERLIKAIFSEEEPYDNYPDTVKEKVGYSQHVAVHTLVELGQAIHRLNRLYSLLTVSEKDDKNELPDIITSNELRMALKPLLRIKSGIDEVTEMLIEVYSGTKTGKPKEV